MRVDSWLKQASKSLEKAGIGSARLDALILVEDLLARDRTYLLAHPETQLSPEQINKLNRQITQRLKHTPLAYIRGFSEFYGRKFKVNKHVLEPRVESETMIDLLKKLPLTKSPLIADIGTGSGAIGITAKLEIPGVEVDLYDIDSYCLAVAKHNAHLHELRLHTYKRDLLRRPARSYEVVLANLPYVPSSWQLHPSILMEPRIAINGGSDGLYLYRRMFAQIEKLSLRPKFVLTESMPPQHQVLAKIAAKHGYILKDKQDFIQVFSND